MIEIKLEKLAGNNNSGKIGKINVKIGDNIKIGDILLQVEAKKGSTPIKSKVMGKVTEILVKEGQVIKVGDDLLKIDEEKIHEEKVDEEKTVKEKIVKKNSATFNYFGNIMKPKKEEITADITIIGTGPGGYVSAIYAAKQGAKVVIIEKDEIGGTCLNWGCIPTKALVRSSEVYNNIKNSSEFGLHAENFSVNMEKVIERKKNVVNELKGGIEYLLEKHGVKRISGFGELVDKSTVFVKNKQNETTIKSNNIIIATGSITSKVPIKGIESKAVLTSKDALDIKKLPKSMVIIGGGVIGMEFAFIFANFGVEVYVVEFADKILSTLDEDICEEITSIAKEMGIKLYTHSKVEAIDESENGGCVVSFTKDNENKFISADKVLLSIGRQPYFEGLGLDKLNIEMNENKKGIKVNEKMQTNIENIYAIGDVTNIIQLAHVASHQGITAVDNIMGKNKKMNYMAVPSAIFTQPEIAIVGMSEKEAKLKGIEVEIGKFPYSANGKALTLGERKGFVKVIKQKSTGKIIGSVIIGVHATDLIAAMTISINNELTAKQITETIFAHPTTAETIHEACLEVEGGAIHFVK